MDPLSGFRLKAVLEKAPALATAKFLAKPLHAPRVGASLTRRHDPFLIAIADIAEASANQTVLYSCLQGAMSEGRKNS